MSLANIINRSAQILRSNSPAILTAFGVSGTLTTAYLTGLASFRAAEDIRKAAPALDSFKDKAQLVWKHYIPAGISGTVTIGCIIGATNVGNRRTAAAASAYTITERAFSEYRDKVAEQIGKHKEQTLRDDIARDHVSNKPPATNEVIVTGSGHILCCEMYTRRYFISDMETLRRARNDINAKINNNLYVQLSEFYELVGLPYTSNSSGVGWDSNKLMELEFSTILTEDGRPCLAFEYNYVKPL